MDYWQNTEDYLRRFLLVSSASFIESELKKILIEFTDSQDNISQSIKYFIKNKAIERQYHTYFDWNAKNTNSFFKLFGQDFQQNISNKISKDKKLDSNVKSFMELGRLRNEIVHENLLEYKLEKTSDEIYSLYQDAFKFINFFKQELYINK